MIKVFKTIIGDNAGKSYDCLINVLFNFEEALKSFRYKNSCVDGVAGDVLYLIFTKIFTIFENIGRWKLTLRLGFNAFHRNTSLAFEVRTRKLQKAQQLQLWFSSLELSINFFLKKLEYDILVYSNYARPKYWVSE